MPEQQGIQALGTMPRHTHLDQNSGGLIYPNSLEITDICRAYLNVPQDIVTATLTKILFDAENYDEGANFDADGVDSNFTAPSTGYYYIGAHAELQNIPANSVAQLSIYLEGARIAQSNQEAGVIENVNLNLISIELIGIGEVIDIRVWHDAGANRAVLNGADLTYVSIYKLGLEP